MLRRTNPRPRLARWRSPCHRIRRPHRTDLGHRHQNPARHPGRARMGGDCRGVLARWRSPCHRIQRRHRPHLARQAHRVAAKARGSGARGACGTSTSRRVLARWHPSCHRIRRRHRTYLGRRHRTTPRHAYRTPRHRERRRVLTRWHPPRHGIHRRHHADLGCGQQHAPCSSRRETDGRRCFPTGDTRPTGTSASTSGGPSSCAGLRRGNSIRTCREFGACRTTWRFCRARVQGDDAVKTTRSLQDNEVSTDPGRFTRPSVDELPGVAPHTGLSSGPPDLPPSAVVRRISFPSR